METQNNNISTKVSAGILSVAVIAGIAFYLSKDKIAQPETSTSIPQTTNTPMMNSGVPQMNQPTGMMRSLYKNGRYIADGAYLLPSSGQATINLSLTIANDVVIDASFTGNAKKGDSKEFQNKFMEGFSTLVIGKNINDINLTVVNGSSLTPKGFMDALTKIKAEAKV